LLTHPDLLLVSWWQSRQASKQASKMFSLQKSIYVL
jgi:hypothetical protein